MKIVQFPIGLRNIRKFIIIMSLRIFSNNVKINFVSHILDILKETLRYHQMNRINIDFMVS